MAWYRRWWNALRPGRLHGDVERELRFHITERMEELQKGGMSAAEAERAARLRFGSFTAEVERTRDMDISGVLDAVVRNVRYGVRSLAKTPAFTVTVMLTLALGIGANSAVFSAIYAVVLRPLPFPDGDQLVRLMHAQPRSGQTFLAPVRLEEWNRLNSTFTGITGYYSEDTSETTGEFPEKLKRAWVAPRFLQVLGVAPLIGRDFTSAEERFGGPQAVMISHRLWQRRFGGNPNVLGKTLRAPSAPFTIVGVMPASFQFPDRDVDLWAVSPPDSPYAQSRLNTWFTAIGRMKPGVVPAEALANLVTVQSNLGRQFPKPDAEITPLVTPLKEATIGGVRRSLWLLFGSVTLLLLIACTNVAALLLSRATARRHETALRFSLGASRSSVVGQLLTEVLILALGGAVLGLLIAAGASSVFRMLAKDLPRIDEMGLNGNIVLYSLLCAVVVTLICGLVPALRGARSGLAVNLAQGGRGHVRGRNRLQLLLVGVQVALAVVLLSGAGLLLRSFQELGRVSPGFDPTQVLTFHISNTWAETGGKGARQRTERLLDGLRAVPGVEAAATAISLPGVPGQYEIELQTTEGRAETEPKMLAQGRWVTRDYFSVMRIPLLAGEVCSDDPDVPSIMVNRTFANLYLNGPAAIGRHLFRPGDNPGPARVVRGIVGDARETGMERQPPAAVYGCAGSLQPGLHFLIRVRGDAGSMAGTIRRKIQELEPQRSVYGLSALTDHISDAYAESRLRMFLLGFFALTAIALTSVGLYGTLSYLVSVRQREMALRMALGAVRTQVARQFLTQGLRVSLVGLLAGLVLAAMGGRVISGMLYGVSATDPATLVAVVLIVPGVAVLASLLPAIRAARLEPMRLLREE
ncbi:MAG: ABC transporter permease [Acidobacteria bacterium]|nr:ABC transporter permease [Acidobacteriota bacterium]